MKPQDIKEAVRGLDPLTDEQLRQLWIAAPYPEVRRLLWEIRRLQQQLISSHRLLTNIANGYMIPPTSIEKNVLELVSEPCIERDIREQIQHALLVRQYYTHAMETTEDCQTWLQSEIQTARSKLEGARQPWETPQNG